MRECWINVYERRCGGQAMGGNQATRDLAEIAAANVARVGLRRPVYRLHVQLKPEGGR